MTGPQHTPPAGKRTATPYIAVKGAGAFIDFLKGAFDAEELGRVPNPDGTIGHAEVRVGDSILMMFDARPEWRDTPSFLCLYVPDADATFARALEAGAEPLTAMTTFRIIGDRVGRVRDPFGNVWWIQTHLEDVSPEESLRRMQDSEEMSVMQHMQVTFTEAMDRQLHQ
jgi:uncharacterized glyoxalase superfamily protein PhnB